MLICLKLDVRTFHIHNYRVATLSKFYLTVFRNHHNEFENDALHAKIVMFKMDILTLWYGLQSCFAFHKVLTAKGIIPESLNSIGQFYHA